MTKVMMSISTEQETKKQFAAFAKSMGSNMNTLLNMYMVAAPKMKQLSFPNILSYEEDPTPEELQDIQEYQQAKQSRTLETVDADDVFKCL